METNHPHSDIEHASNYYVPLLRGDDRRRSVGVGAAVIATSVLFLISLVALIVVNQGPRGRHDHNLSKPLSRPPERMSPPERGKPEGVSEKSFSELGDVVPFNWTNTMLSWQRTAYHFQPQRNWMNDPDGPLYHMGWYHLFYQYNPDSAVWGNITWGHAVSRDLIHWLYLPFAMVPDHWFDWFGVWTGSATLLPDGRIFMIYTGDTDNYVQVQNLAYPANLSDPLLLNWTKYADNPVIFPPPGIAPKNFRDPTTAWVGPDGSWRVAIGSEINNGGMALVYRTTNFTSFELLDGPLHSVPGTGMWECVDFYPISTTGPIGLNTSANGPGTKHVLKASINNDTRDYYALGMYDPINDTWAPDNLDMDIGMGLKYDHGMYYASKTFYDESKERRILWGWIQETDAEENDIQKGWASVQTIPRVVVFDNKTGANILQWPVEEVESLRLRSTEFASIELAPGSILPLQVGPATQLDISVEFQVEFEGFEKTRLNDDESYNCTAGAATRGTFGPFGVIVLADDALSELTPVYFHVVKGDDGVPATFFCADQSRSTLATDIYKIFYGGKVPVLKGENLSMRLLVDHSIVESFAQGGRSVITARVYPTKAIYGAARIFLFNNATGIKVTANVTVWEMNSAFIHPFPL